MAGALHIEPAPETSAPDSSDAGSFSVTYFSEMTHLNYFKAFCTAFTASDPTTKIKKFSFPLEEPGGHAFTPWTPYYVSDIADDTGYTVRRVAELFSKAIPQELEEQSPGKDETHGSLTILLGPYWAANNLEVIIRPRRFSGTTLGSNGSDAHNDQEQDTGSSVN